MTRKPRQQRARATVDTIVEAGFISVARHGFDGTTTRHIAEIAGLGVGSLYEYFANKDEIYAAMNRHFVDEILALIRPLIPELARMEIRPAVRTLVSAFEAFLCRNDERYLKYARAALGNAVGVDSRPIGQALSDLVLQYVLHHPQIARLGDLPVMSHIFIEGGMYVVLKHLSNPAPPFTFAALGDGLARMVEHYVGAELAALPKPGGRKKKRKGGTSDDPAHPPV